MDTPAGKREIRIPLSAKSLAGIQNTECTHLWPCLAMPHLDIVQGQPLCAMKSSTSQIGLPTLTVTVALTQIQTSLRPSTATTAFLLPALSPLPTTSSKLFNIYSAPSTTTIYAAYNIAMNPQVGPCRDLTMPGWPLCASVLRLRSLFILSITPSLLEWKLRRCQIRPLG